MRQPGDVIAGKYRVETILGRGAMGEVVAALDVELQRRVAIKFMLAEGGPSAEAIERFLREARAAARIEDEHAVKVYDVGKLESGEPYIVMEHLKGTDLKTHLDQRGRLDVEEAVFYVLQACAALGEAHALGIVHRDLKPANLFLAKRLAGPPCVKVLDFGIAKLRDPVDANAEFQMTSTGALMGTPTYMSPEQISSSRGVDARADIWSLGVILYRLVTGKLPFQAPSMPGLFNQVLNQPPAPPSVIAPHLPPGLEAVILRCLEKNVDLRYQSIAELSLALSPFAQDLPRMSANPPSGCQVYDSTQTANAWPSSSGRGSRPSLPHVSTELAAPVPREPPAPTRAPSSPALSSGTPTNAQPEIPTNASWAQKTRGSQGRPHRAPLAFGIVGLLGLVVGLAFAVLDRLKASSSSDSSAAASAAMTTPAAEGVAPATVQALTAAPKPPEPPPSASPDEAHSAVPSATGRAPAPPTTPPKPAKNDPPDPYGPEPPEAPKATAPPASAAPPPAPPVTNPRIDPPILGKSRK